MVETSELELHDQIVSLVREAYKIRHKPEVFVPGETPVRVGGRVFDEDELVNLVDASLDFWLTEGPYCVEFAQALSKMMRMKYTVLVNSGSSANLLAFAALMSPNLGEKRLRPGDEVITVAASFPTTVNPIIQNGCVPVFLDINLGNYNVDVSQLEEAFSSKTRAIFLAHTLGNPFDITAVMSFAERHDLYVIEDTCDALGSTYNGQLVGSFGHLSTYSLYPAHHITTGEGGAVLTKNSWLYRAVNSLRNWGRDCWCMPGHDNTCRKRFGWQLGNLPMGYDHKNTYTHIGYNLKMLDLQAAVGIAQMKKLDGFAAARQRNFNWLYEGLERYEDIFYLPKATERSVPSWFGFPLTLKPEATFDRATITGFLEDRKIMTRVLFTGNILRQPAYEDVDCRVVGDLARTEYVAENTFYIGVYPGLNEEMISYTLECFHDFLGGR